jgi:hypothetical protein
MSRRFHRLTKDGVSIVVVAYELSDYFPKSNARSTHQKVVENVSYSGIYGVLPTFG